MAPLLRTAVSPTMREGWHSMPVDCKRALIATMTMVGHWGLIILGFLQPLLHVFPLDCIHPYNRAIETVLRGKGAGGP